MHRRRYKRLSEEAAVKPAAAQAVRRGAGLDGMAKPQANLLISLEWTRSNTVPRGRGPADGEQQHRERKSSSPVLAHGTNRIARGHRAQVQIVITGGNAVVRSEE
jgi:hypothetical protein